MGRNFATNGVFLHDTTAEDSKHTCKDFFAKNLVSASTAPTASSPSAASAARSPSRRAGAMATPPTTSARTPFQDEPEVDQPRQYRGLQERARLLRHELEVRQRSTTPTSTTTGSAWSRTRSTPSRMSQPATGSSRTTTSSGTTSTTSCRLAGSDRLERTRTLPRDRRRDDQVPDRCRDRALRVRRLERQEQRDLRQLQVGRPCSRIRSTTVTTRSARTTSSSTTSMVAAAPTST